MQELIKGKSRLSNLRSEIMRNPDFNDSILGQVCKFYLKETLL